MTARSFYSGRFKDIGLCSKYYRSFVGWGLAQVFPMTQDCESRGWYYFLVNLRRPPFPMVCRSPRLKDLAETSPGMSPDEFPAPRIRRWLDPSLHSACAWYQI